MAGYPYHDAEDSTNSYRNPQNPYENGGNGFGNFGRYSPPGGFSFQSHILERKRLRAFSHLAAIGTGGFYLIANLLYLPVGMFLSDRLLGKDEASLILSMSVDMVITMLALLLPYGLAHLYAEKKLSVPKLPMGKPKTSAGTTILLVMMGCGLLMLASIVTSQLTYFFEETTGIVFEYAFFDNPKSVLGILIFYLRSAIMPALVEEFAMRGVCLQPLRRYGDLFAIGMSSMVFALMHGNMVQAPFALAAGFILGFITIRTGSLWPSIFIHFINNSLSVTIGLLEGVVDDTRLSIISLASTVGMIALGILAALILWRTGKLGKANRNLTVLTTGECVKSYIFTLPMLLVLFYMLVQTAMMIQLPDVFNGMS